MSRAHFWQYLINTEGQPIPNADVSVYNAGGTTPAYVFDSETGGDAFNTLPQTTTDDNGFFEFWIGDHTELNGYQAGLKFKLAWSKTGTITPGEIDNVDISVDTNQAGVYTETVEAAQFTTAGPLEYIDITHNLNKPYPMAVCYDDASDECVAITIKHISDNVTRISRTGALKSHITIAG